MNKRALFRLVAVGLMILGFFPMYNVLRTSAKQWTGLAAPYGVAIGDFNWDGNVDLAFAEIAAGLVSVYDGLSPYPLWWASPLGAPPPPLVSPFGVAIGDYDSDGVNDIAISDYNGGAVYVYSGLPGWPLLDFFGNLAGPSGVAIGDYNGDQVNELVFAEFGTGLVYFYRFPSTPAGPVWPFFASPTGVAIGDYDPFNPGNEVAVADFGPGTVSVFNQFGGLTGPPWGPGLLGPEFVSIGDFDNNPANGNELAFAEISGAAPDGTVKIFSSGYLPAPLKVFQVIGGAAGVAIGGDFGNCGWIDLAFSDGNSKVTVYRWGDLGGLVVGIPTYFAYDDKVDGTDLALWINCFKGLSPPNANYLADIGGPVGGAPTFFAFDGLINGYDLALFIACYRGLGPGRT